MKIKAHKIKIDGKTMPFFVSVKNEITGFTCRVSVIIPFDDGDYMETRETWPVLKSSVADSGKSVNIAPGSPWDYMDDETESSIFSLMTAAVMEMTSSLEGEY